MDRKNLKALERASGSEKLFRLLVYVLVLGFIVPGVYVFLRTQNPSNPSSLPTPPPASQDLPLDLT